MSSPTPVTTGFAFRDSFVYQKADSTFQTGLTQASFTLRFSKDGVGNRSTTGITITEVDATNNPGEYAILFASTVFASSGEYVLTITHTAAPAYTWEQVFTASATGLPTASGVGFTATAGNGRVYSGGAVSGASVYVASGSTIYAVLTTDASGLWGPVYFNADGTYTVTAQKTGYASAAGTVVVSGGATVATGPGADLTLTASVTNPLSASELWAYFTRQARDPSGPKADIERKQGVRDALDMVCKAHRWPFTIERAQLQLNPGVSVSLSFTVGSTTATLTSGTLPSWVSTTNVPRLLFQNRLINIAAATAGGTTFTLETPYQDPAGGTVTGSGTLFQDEYLLPDDMFAFGQIVPGQRWGHGAVNVGVEKFYQLQTVTEFGMQQATAYCIHNQRLMLYPYPNKSTELLYTYYRRPANLVSGADIADVDPALLELVYRAIDVQVAIRYGSYQGGDRAAAEDAYNKALATAIGNAHSPANLANALDDGDIWSQRLSRTDWHRRSY